ncbi:MAG: oxidoreductase family protein, partial [Granulosicoccaceae bacterium]
QKLWSGYGEIVRYQLRGSALKSVVVKQIALPQELAHPRGWHTDTGHRRKLRSYEVECNWYRDYAAQCGDRSKVARCYGVLGEGMDCALVLQDLDAVGFDQRLQHASPDALLSSIAWLACFHAQWLEKPPQGLWQRGSYWHLKTRSDELAAMADGPLKIHAQSLDNVLANASFQTLIHGDAKIANFCYTRDHTDLAAVDFQYVGRGVGVCDLAYFLGSCLDGSGLHSQAEVLLDYYFEQLAAQVQHSGVLNSEQLQQLLTQWRALYPVAWADFERFLQGWSPGHAKLNSYSKQMTEQALKSVARVQ